MSARPTSIDICTAGVLATVRQQMLDLRAALAPFDRALYAAVNGSVGGWVDIIGDLLERNACYLVYTVARHAGTGELVDVDEAREFRDLDAALAYVHGDGETGGFPEWWIDRLGPDGSFTGHFRSWLDRPTATSEVAA